MGRAWLAKTARSQFLHQIAGTLGTRLTGILAGLITSVLIARALGADGRGALAIAATIAAVGVQLGNLGLHVTNTSAVARDKNLLGSLLSNALVVSLIGGAGAYVVVLGIELVHPETLPVSGTLLILAVMGVPLGLAGLFTQNLLLGLSHVRDFNVVDLAGRGLGVATTIVIILLGLASPIAFMAAGNAGSIVLIAATVLYLRRIAGRLPTPSLTLFRAYWRIGGKAYLTALMSFLVIRVDLFLVDAYRGFADVGRYTVATALGDLFMTLPVVVGTILFPKLAATSSPSQRYAMTKSTGARVGMLMTAAGLIAAILAGPAIDLLYGPQFGGAAAAFLYLLPGLVALSISVVFMNFYATLGFPRPALIASAAGLALNIPLNMFLLPHFGIVGASVSSSLAYGAMLGISAGSFRRYRPPAQPVADVLG